jgi:hypothetical protein
LFWPDFSQIHLATLLGLPGTDVMIFKIIFAEKISENICVFFAQSTASFCKKN